MIRPLPSGYRPARRSEPSPLEALLEAAADWYAERPWIEQAACASADPEAWFPEKGQSTIDAKRVCADCPVLAECRSDVLARGERFGVWGGMSERDRRRATQVRERVAA